MTRPMRLLVATLLLAAPAAGQDTLLKPGETVRGALEATDSVDGEGYTYDAIRLDPRTADRIFLLVESDAFDAYLQVGALVDGEFRVIANQDESPVDADPSAAGLFVPVRRAPWADWELVARVSGTHADAEGPYIVRMAEAMPEDAEPMEVTVPGRVRGVLTETDVQPFLAFQDRYRFRGSAGRRVLVGMTADFDTFLYLNRIDGEEVTELTRDDDGWGGNDAFIEFDVREDGEYEIVASSYRQVLGEYRLEVWEAPRLVPAIDPVPDAETNVALMTGINMTDQERDALVVDDSVIRNDVLGFRFPAPKPGLFISPATKLMLDTRETPPNMTGWVIQDSNETVVISIVAFKTIGGINEELFTGVTRGMHEEWTTTLTQPDWTTVTAADVDWDSRSFVWSAVDPTPTGPDSPSRVDVRCEASGPARNPGLLVCLVGLVGAEIGPVDESLRATLENLEIRESTDG